MSDIEKAPTEAQLKEAFKLFDAGHDNVITLYELRDGLKKFEHHHHNFEWGQVFEMIHSVDHHDNSKLDFQEFTELARREKWDFSDLQTIEERKASRFTTEFAKFGLQLFAGGGAGATSKTVVAPLERIKVLLQLQHMRGGGPQYTSIRTAVNGIIKHEGYIALWKGNVANCVRIIPVCALKFTFFDRLKAILLPKGRQFTDGQMFGRRILAGATSGCMTLLCVFPLEVIKTRTQASHGAVYTGMADCAGKIFRNEGVLGLYKGLAPSLVGIAPYLGTSFATFDSLKYWYARKYNVTEANVPSWAKLSMGAVAGVIAQTLVFPIDTVRNRMMMNALGGGKKKYPNSLTCFKMVYQQEGFKALYKGVSTNMIKAAPSVAIEFYCYDTFKKLFFKHITDRK